MRRISIEEASMLSVLAKSVVLKLDNSKLIARLRITPSWDIAEQIILGVETGIAGSYLDWARQEIKRNGN